MHADFLPCTVKEKNHSDTCENSKEDFIQDYHDGCQDCHCGEERSGSTLNTSKTIGGLALEREGVGGWRRGGISTPGFFSGN